MVGVYEASGLHIWLRSIEMVNSCCGLASVTPYLSALYVDKGSTDFLFPFHCLLSSCGAPLTMEVINQIRRERGIGLDIAPDSDYGRAMAFYQRTTHTSSEEYVLSEKRTVNE